MKKKIVSAGIGSGIGIHSLCACTTRKTAGNTAQQRDTSTAVSRQQCCVRQENNFKGTDKAVVKPLQRPTNMFSLPAKEKGILKRVNMTIQEFAANKSKSP